MLKFDLPGRFKPITDYTRDEVLDIIARGAVTHFEKISSLYLYAHGLQIELGDDEIAAVIDGDLARLAQIAKSR